jgi:hypothetical protein
MSQNDLIESIRKAALVLQTTRLSAQAFRLQSGIKMNAVYKHFDSWSDACLAAGVNHGPTHENLVPRPKISLEDCLAEMKRVALLLGKRQLSSKDFSRYAKFTAKPVIKRFGSWPKALKEAGLEPCTKALLDTPLSVDECVLELKRVAELVGSKTLKTADLADHSSYSSYRIVRACGGWNKALSMAGLLSTPNYRQRIPIEILARSFLRAVIDLERIPTLLQVSRRSGHASDTLSRNRDGYSAFKVEAIEFLLSLKCNFPKGILGTLRDELTRLKRHTHRDSAQAKSANEHRQGRTLGFRGFAFAPTCEHDVVQLFGAVANDLGFEIVGNRSAFPDCRARRLQKGQREHFIDCLIEYEFSSRDFKKHRHDPKGCDLVICWKHNWLECPVEVLELKQAITKLTGWE